MADKRCICGGTTFDGTVCATCGICHACKRKHAWRIEIPPGWENRVCVFCQRGRAENTQVNNRAGKLVRNADGSWQINWICKECISVAFKREGVLAIEQKRQWRHISFPALSCTLLEIQDFEAEQKKSKQRDDALDAFLNGLS